jgi:DASS family divalent anion:Na+ symporter
MQKTSSSILCITIFILFWILPAPQNLSLQGWHLFGMFLTTIVAIITNILPIGAISLIAFTLSVSLNVISTKNAFAGFSNPVAWLILIAFFLAQTIVDTGLGRRIALNFIKLLGKSTLGLSYGLAVCELLIAPTIPSVTARSGGIIMPIIQSISNLYDSKPNCQSANKIGAFIISTTFQVSAVTCAMFMTAMGANPILAALSMEQQIHINWGSWAIAGMLPGIISIAIIPLAIYLIYPPKIKHTPKTPQFAIQQLLALGKMKAQEYILIFVILLLLILWIFGTKFNLDPTIAAMIGVCILLISKTLNWHDAINNSTAWESFLWYSILVMLAKHLGDYGVITWLNTHMIFLKNLDWQITLPLIAMIYFYSHYFFVSSTAHVLSMFPTMLSLSILSGAPPQLAAYVLIFLSSLYGGLTHYSIASAPILYGAGYVSIKQWWKIGFICSVINIFIWSTIGVIWWKVIGIW